MQAKLRKKRDIVIVNLSGRVDMECTEPFRRAMFQNISPKSRDIVFNFHDLDFVGSNGIMPFVQVISDLSLSEKRIKFCGVKSEFQRIFSASSLSEIEIFDSEDGAMDSLKSDS